MNKSGNGERQILHWLAGKGCEYVQNILAEDLRNVGVTYPKELTENPWKSARWMLSSFFYRGRRDELSREYCRAALEAMDEVTKDLHDPRDRVQASASRVDAINRLYKGLVGQKRTMRGKNYKVNPNDVDLLESYLSKYVPSIQKYEFNPVRQVLAEVDHLDNIHAQLCEIRSVGPKLASMFLRDVVCLFEKEDDVRKAYRELLQPVDTWVRRVAGHLWPDLKSASDTDIRIKIVDSCARVSRADSKVSPVNVNQGMWYVGTRSLEVLLELERST